MSVQPPRLPCTLPTVLPLSPCERLNLALAAHGWRDYDIARWRGVDYCTVRNQMSAAREKLGVQDRTSAVMAALRQAVRQ